MKAIFEDLCRNTSLTISVNEENELSIENHSTEPEELEILSITDLKLSEAYKLQRWLNACIAEIEEKERQKIPVWKRIL